jgi:hypothetical protein
LQDLGFADSVDDALDWIARIKPARTILTNLQTRR